MGARSKGDHRFTYHDGRSASLFFARRGCGSNQSINRVLYVRRRLCLSDVDPGCGRNRKLMKAKSKDKQPVTAFARFQSLIRSLVAVPKKEVEIEEARWREARLKKKKSAT